MRCPDVDGGPLDREDHGDSRRDTERTRVRVSESKALEGTGCIEGVAWEFVIPLYVEFGAQGGVRSRRFAWRRGERECLVANT